MLPGVYEFRWDAGHVIFVGVFLLVLASLAALAGIAFWRARRDFCRGGADALRWHEDFESLPAASRRCRHELAGDVLERECERGFDCRTCTTHAALEANAIATGTVETVQGLSIPLDRFYDRRHSWAQVLANGRVRLGLDALAERLLGAPDAVTLPKVGTMLHRHGTAWRAWKSGRDIRFTAPVDGTVTAVGGPDAGWYVEIDPQGTPDLSHLLRGREVRPWMSREVERLQALVSTPTLGTTLADGGLLMPDPAGLQPDADWELVWSDLFLQA